MLCGITIKVLSVTLEHANDNQKTPFAKIADGLKDAIAMAEEGAIPLDRFEVSADGKEHVRIRRFKNGDLVSEERMTVFEWKKRGNKFKRRMVRSKNKKKK